MKLDQLAELTEEIEDLELLKDEYDQRIAELAQEIMALNATDRLPFEDILLALVEKEATSSLTTADDAAFDSTLQQARDYTNKMTALGNERNQLLMKSGALDDHMRLY